MDHRTVAVVMAMAASGAVAGSAQTPETKVQENSVLLAGAVTMNDSSPPPASVLVRRICNSHIESETWTDSRGRYSFKIDGSRSAAGSGDAAQAAERAADLNRPFGNATQYSNPVTSALRDCEVTAILAGYRSDSVRLEVRSTMDDSRIPTIVLFPLSRADALSVSATSEMAPKNARKAYEKGVAAMKVQDWNSAGRELTQAVKEFSKFAEAWFDLGLAREKQGDSAGAFQAWQEAANADGKYLLPYEKLATYADREGRWDEAAKYSSAWIQLDPADFPAAYLVNAIANARLRHMDEAERSARAGLLIDKNRRMPRLSYVLGLILVEKHQDAESVKQFRDYLKYAPEAKDAEIVREQISRLDPGTAAAKQ